MSTIFSKIISGDIPSFKVAETEFFLAFLDIQPLRKGHVLVIPKKEVDNLFDLEDEDLSGLMIFAKYVAKKIEKVFDCKKVGVAVIGLEVAHAHVHLVPINDAMDLDFTQAKLSLSMGELEKIALLLREA